MAEELIERLNRLGDHSLAAIRWDGEASNVTFVLRKEFEQSPVLREVTCHFFRNLVIDFDFGGLCDSPLLWDSEFQQLDSGLWQLVMDFRGSACGLIQLEAVEVTVNDFAE